MAYRVVRAFSDIQDNYHVYSVGDGFPRAGVVVGEQRINQLATGKNATGKPVIEIVEDSKSVEKSEEQPKRTRKPKKSE